MSNNQPARQKSRPVLPKPVAKATGPLTDTVTLAGQSYTVTELPVRPSEAWRKQLTESFGVISEVLGVAQQLQGDNPEEALKSIDLKDAASLANSLMSTLLGSIGTVMDLVFAYSPELQADRDRIENAAYGSEFIDAFVVILKLAYPVSKYRGLLGGLMARSISKS